MRPFWHRVAVVVALGAASAGAQEPDAAARPSAAIAPRPPAIALSAESLRQRYEFVGNLLERSSSARQLATSGTPESRQVHQQARETRERAKEALAGGDLPQADALLREATQLMMKAVRLAHPEEISAEKHKLDFNNRRDSVKTLLASGKRVAGEKGASKPEFGKAEDLLREGESLAAENKHLAGKAKLDAAYLLIKDALREMRGGEQLTADKNFATKADEFRYEQGRNDDYQNLIGGVVGSQPNPNWEAMAKSGRSLRDEADAIGKSGDFDAALRKIGESTNQLKSILRAAGFPIL